MKIEEIEFLKNLNGYNTEEGKRATNAVKEYTEVVKKDVLNHVKAVFLIQGTTNSNPDPSDTNNMLITECKTVVIDEIIDSYVNIALDNISIRHNIHSFFNKDIEEMKKTVKEDFLNRFNY